MPGGKSKELSLWLHFASCWKSGMFGIRGSLFAIHDSGFGPERWAPGFIECPQPTSEGATNQNRELTGLSRVLCPVSHREERGLDSPEGKKRKRTGKKDVMWKFSSVSSNARRSPSGQALPRVLFLPRASHGVCHRCTVQKVYLQTTSSPDSLGAALMHRRWGRQCRHRTSRSESCSAS